MECNCHFALVGRILCLLLAGITFLGFFSHCADTQASRQQLSSPDDVKADTLTEIPMDTAQSEIDTAAYRFLMSRLSINQPDNPWPVKEIIPGVGALLPFHRIIAYYGNFYSSRMGILGGLPPDQMLDKLKQEVALWKEADTTIQVIPALHYIAVTAQREPGKNNTYRLRMPEKEILKVMEMAETIDAQVFLDIQVGHSTLQEEIPPLRAYLQQPNVHLGIDPEYSMKGGEVPGRKVGTFDAEDINYAMDYLAAMVREYQLPPKVLVVHRFKRSMVTNYDKIKIIPEVQVVIHMDGFGNKAKKLTTYQQAVTSEPVQFAGFKIFYKNDAERSETGRIMQPEEVLKLHPVPVYIQYQ